VLKVAVVFIAAIIAMLLFAPLSIGLGRGLHSSSTYWFFGVVRWLIVTRETVTDPNTQGIEHYRHVVINPQGAALTLAAATIGTAAIVWCWRKTGRLSTSFN